jgi:hypothetical protein
MTRGCRILDRGQWSKRQKRIITPAWKVRIDTHHFEAVRFTYLDDEYNDGILWIVMCRILAFQDSALSLCSSCGSRRGGHRHSLRDRVRHESSNSRRHDEEFGSCKNKQKFVPGLD